MVRWYYGVNKKQFNPNYRGSNDIEETDVFNNTSKFMTMLGESFVWFQFYLELRHHSFLSESLSQFVLEYYQHGLLTYSEMKWYPPPLGADPEDEAQVLTMFMLSTGFIIWLITVAVCVLVFFIEIIVDRTRKMCKQMNEMLKWLHFKINT